ncbi:hypothetical protein [Roseinatronobacter sp. S2]|uniref:hypothetical protein n=1 Tax=Roseinatronobacter sp. S2 TaxID=3035471 RepID=UPI00241095F5|nr:hypothetical protein [Roseinatronobacter sp. S2]WFE77303.1 hypothetical protein P8S53_21090 [Roseinatronobacter sp. S2]
MAVIPTAADLGVTITKGTVVRAGAYISGGTIYRDQASTTIHSTPEIWLQDEAGREQHYRADAFDGIREGHALIIVHDANSGALLRVMNRNTCSTIDRSALIPDTSGWAVIRVVFRKLFTIFLPAAFGAFYLLQVTGLSDTFIASLFGFASNFLLIYCGYLGWRAAKETAAKTRERRAGLDALFRQKGWTKDKAV